MEIRIYNLKLKNFKGIKDLEINFDGKDTNIYGKNATGKTTIFDAFKWLFFNKDSTERTVFEVKTLDDKNEPIHFLEHEVEATLIIDGRDMIFRRVLKEKWVKKRGQEKEEYAGTDESSYWIDEVPVQLKDYNEKINEIIPESEFKLITDPLYFNVTLNDKERRKTLISILGEEYTDEKILEKESKFEDLKNSLQGKSVEDYGKILSERIDSLNKDKKEIPTRIDELTKTLITEHNINYEDLENEKSMYNEELQKIETEMTDIQARARENIKKADQLAVAKNELNNLKFRLEVEHNDKYSKNAMKLQNDKSLIENKLRNKHQEYDERALKIEQDQKRKEELYKKWDDVNNLTLEFDPNSFICPTCKRELASEQIEEKKKEMESNFNNHKNAEKQAINTEGQTLNIRIQENTTARKQLQVDINELNIQLETINKELEKIENKQTEKDFDVTSLPAYKEKQKEVDMLQEEVNKIVNSDTTEIQIKKTKIIEQINEIDKKLNERDVQEKTKSRIEELEKQEEEISQKVQELESQQFQIEEFTRFKVRLIEETINDNFELIKFRLFKKQKNGGLNECCEAMINGVPYSDVNNAHKIIAGLDIINTLSKVYDKTAPIFIDNRESINRLCKTNAQIISLIVTEDPKLRIEVI